MDSAIEFFILLRNGRSMLWWRETSVDVLVIFYFFFGLDMKFEDINFHKWHLARFELRQIFVINMLSLFNNYGEFLNTRN